MTDNAHKVETPPQTSTIKWQLTTEAFAKATGNSALALERTMRTTR